jgi:hypothetical protein
VIWLKRLSPLAVIFVLWFAYSSYDKYREKKFTAEADHRAQATAQIWMASARYRKDPARYQVYRDSVLRVNSLSQSEMDGYLKLLEGDVDRQEYFSGRISFYVDSLFKIEDSVRRVEARRVADSVKAAKIAKTDSAKTK